MKIRTMPRNTLPLSVLSVIAVGVLCVTDPTLAQAPNPVARAQARMAPRPQASQPRQVLPQTQPQQTQPNQTQPRRPQAQRLQPPRQQLAPRAPQPQQPRQQRTPIFRHADVDSAWAAAQESGRPVMVYVTSSNCFYCKKMVAETLSHPQIIRATNARFETALLSKDKQPELVKKLGVKAFPTTLIVNTNGSLLGRVDGFVEPAKFAARVLAGPKQARRDASPTPRQPQR